MSAPDEKPSSPSPPGLVPGSEAETVQLLVAREIENLKRGLDLEYRIKDYLDLRERRRRILMEAGDLEMRMKRLAIPPAILKNL